jgi:predicted transposase/invertase (TIGR01784 family)
LSEESASVNSYHLKNDRTNHVFTELEHIIILELPKLAGEVKEKVELWMKFLKGGSLEEMEMLGKRDEALGKAVGVLKELSWSDRHRMRAEAREKWRKDVISWKKDAYKQGHAEGLIRGRQEDARKMKELGDSVDKISVVTGLSEEEIRRL